MDFKKCARCGCFFISEDSVCCHCKPKDKMDEVKLQNYLEEHSMPASLEEISIGTGIALKNLSRLEGIQKLDGILGEKNLDPNKPNISIEL